MSKRAEFKSHGPKGTTASVGDVYDYQRHGTISTHVYGDTGSSNATVCLSPDAMRALAADLTLAAALVEENIERKKNAA